MRRAAAIFATAALALVFTGFGMQPQAAQAAPYGQCDSLFNTPGLGMDCTVAVVNNLDLATGETSSVTTYTRCFGAANTALTCEGPTVVESTELVTSVSQCNSSLDGGGASMHCSVHVTNNIVGDAAAVAATVNQCNGSLGGGGIVLRACNPDPAITSGAAINQCNNSVNLGGSSLTCVVTAGSTTISALYVTVSQCNYSANGGGSLIVCTTGMTNNVTPAAVVPPVEEDVVEEEAVDEEEFAGQPPTTVDSVTPVVERPESLADTGSTIDFPPLPAVMLAAIGVLLLAHRRLARDAQGRV